MVLLDEQQIKSMAPGRFFRDHTGPINSLDFHHTEDVMVTVGASADLAPLFAARLDPRGARRDFPLPRARSSDRAAGSSPR